MRISAEVDYAVRACLELAVAEELDATPRPVKAEETVSLAEIAAGELPVLVADLAADPGAWQKRS